MVNITQEQIAELKAKHGRIYKLVAENGMTCILKDPLSDFKIVKAAFSALNKNSILFVQTILSNCFLTGDEAIKTDESIQIGLVDQINELIDIPEAEIERIAQGFTVTVEGFTVNLRAAKRDDISSSEQRNSGREPFMTNKYILDKIALCDLKPIESNCRAYIGLLTAIDKVKEKTIVSVEKL
jgi:hypothetical protein